MDTYSNYLCSYLSVFIFVISFVPSLPISIWKELTITSLRIFTKCWSRDCPWVDENPVCCYWAKEHITEIWNSWGNIKETRIIEPKEVKFKGENVIMTFEFMKCWYSEVMCFFISLEDRTDNLNCSTRDLGRGFIYSFSKQLMNANFIDWILKMFKSLW